MKNALKLITRYMDSAGKMVGFDKHNSQNWREFLDNAKNMDGDWRGLLSMRAISEPEICFFVALHLKYPTESQEEIDKRKNAYLGNLNFLWKWRDSKIVYKFDKDLENALLNDTHFSIDDEVPVEALKNLPHKSFYIDTEHNPLSEEGKRVFLEMMGEKDDAIMQPDRFMGIFVNWFDRYDRDGNVEPGGHLLFNVLFHELEPEENYYNIGLKTNPPYRVISSCLTIPKDGTCSIKEAQNLIESDEKYRPIVAKMNLVILQYILYLCAENSIVRPLGKQGNLKHKRKTYAEAKDPAKFSVTFPKEIQRNFPPTTRGTSSDRNEIRITGSEEESHGKRAVAPHERRAHWHSYWVGGRKGSEKAKLVLKWLFPILVNYGKGEAGQTNVIVK